MNTAVTDLIKELKLSAHELTLIGDGSGTTLEHSCGFACVAYYHKEGTVYICRGSLSNGTNNLAELMPYIHALWIYEYQHKVANRFWNYTTKVEVISDSELTVKQGNKQYVRGHGPNAMLWQAIQWFEDNGYSIHWNHVLRNTNSISKLCDQLAGEQRKLQISP